MTREIAFEILSRVQNDDAYANLLLPTLVRRANLDSRDAGFVQELAFGTIRSWLLYERILEKASSRKIGDIEDAAQIALVLGVHQLLEMRVPTHAAINESVNLAKAKASHGAVGFVNAVLRKVAAKDKDAWIDEVTSGLSEIEALSVKYSHPIWIVKAFNQALSSRGISSDLEDLVAADNLAAKVSLIALPGFATKEEILDAEIRNQPSPYGLEISGNPADIPQVRNGFARVQDQGSQLVTVALTEAEIQTDETGWLDMCAGPGGKAALLASIAKQRQISMVSNEISEHRAQLVRNSLDPLGNFEVRVSDARAIGDEGAKYSRILLDAPCTGLGALRRRPEARWRKSPEDLIDLVKLQRELIVSAWNALIPGGVLAYITCSPHLSETTAHVAWAEKEYGSELELLNANVLLHEVNEDLRLDRSLKTAQLWPHLHSTDAMFLALFRKSVN